ncbi:hypothetical protein BU17DRAFT_71514 [Hysterangium stoloniferum]|nr:hypothetical protein BU17DRAFT_71514 [Hysterangium stoloniferum]
MVQPTHAVFVTKDHFGLPEDDEDEDGDEQGQKRRGVRWPFHYLMGGKSEMSGQQGIYNHLSEFMDVIDSVPTGLIGGRLGNKGGVGVSINLTELSSFHQSHEDKVPLCVANLSKIKAELPVDAFLLPNYPPTLAEGE